MGTIRLRFGFIIILALSVTVSTSSYGYNNRLKPADMVLLNGKIVTMDENRPEAEAIAIRKDIIIAVGSNEDIRQYIGNTTRVIDIGGLLAVPGFIEGHGHLLSLGQSKMELDLTRARNWDEILSMVKNNVRNAKPGEWIIGSGWHQEKWDKVPSPDIGGYPIDETLNRVSPYNPVMLTHASGHALFANGKAMGVAGVTKDTTDPKGGRILRDSQGNPTGVFFDAAQDLISRAHERSLANRTPKQIKSQLRKAIGIAVRECLSKGITSFQDASSSFREVDLYKKLISENVIPIRLWVMIHEDNGELAANLARYRIIGFGDKRLTVRAIKKFMDGALGAHTAWMLEPYSDLPGSTGLNVESRKVIREAAVLALKNHFQLCVHAIGDRANRETLDIFEAAFKKAADGREFRWRIEHAQHLSAVDIPRFARLGVIASMQTVHCISDGPWVSKRLGAHRTEEGAYVWQKLMRSLAVVANGTDAPVEDVDPIANFYAAVTRRLPDGSTLYADQRMSREQALRSCTINNAYAAFEDSIKGSLEPGKLGDLTVLSKDIMNAPEEEIRTAKVVYTIVGGRIMYSSATKGRN